MSVRILIQQKQTTMTQYTLTCFILLSCALSAFAIYGYGSDRVLLRDVRGLTFDKGHWTNSRRGYSVPQLFCNGGSASSNQDLYPNTVYCRNMGRDYSGEIQWKCEADLDQRVKFGRMTVSCEGYNGVDDEWVVDGSCSLQYELERTYTDDYEYSDENARNGWKFGPFFGWVSLAGVVLAILRSLTSPFRGALFPYFITSVIGWIVNRFRTPAVHAEVPPHTRRTRFAETYDEPEDIGVGRTRTTVKVGYAKNQTR